MLVTQSDSGILGPKVEVGQGEKEEKKEEKKLVQLNRISDGRTINSLPLHSPHNYTPYFNLEFDLAVQDYCRNQINQANLLNKHSEWLDNSSASKFFTRQVKNSLKKKPSSTTSSKLYNSSQLIDSGDLSNKTVRNCKVVVSGDVAVGKTSLVNRFGHGTYSSNYKTTIGVDFDLQRFNILSQPYVLQVSTN